MQSLPRNFLIALATALLIRGLWLIPDGSLLVVHSDQQFIGHLVDFFAALEAGIIFPQWSVFARNGFGSPYLGYYQPGFYYVAAVCLWLTKNPQTAIALATTLLTLVGAVGMFKLSRHLFRFSPSGSPNLSPSTTDNLAAFATAAFLCHPYQLVNLYQRGDYSEFACAMLLPWSIVFAIHSASEKPRIWLQYLPPTAVALAACVILHPLLAYPMFLAMFFVSRRLWPALTVAGLLSAFYWLPLLAEMQFITVDKAFVPELQPARHLLSLSHALMIPSSTTGASSAPFILEPNWALVGFAACGILSTLRRGGSLHRLAAIVTAITFVVIFMMTPWSLWIWEYLPFLAKLQFPWRLQNFAAILTAILATIGLAQFRRTETFSYIVITALIAIPVAWNMTSTKPGRPIENTDDLARSGFLVDTMDEWMPKTATIRMGLGDQPALVDGPCQAGRIHRSPGELRIPLSLTPGLSKPPQLSDTCIVTVPHFFYPAGWHAALRLPAQPAQINTLAMANRDGFIEISVSTSALTVEPQDAVLSNKMTPWRKIGVGVTMFTAFFLAGLSAFFRRRRFRTDDSLTS